jgi:spore germination protein GerM
MGTNVDRFLSRKIRKYQKANNQLDDLIFSMRQSPTSHELASAIPNTLTLAKEPLLTQQDDGSQLVSIWFSSTKYDSLTSQQIYMLSGALTLAIYCNLPGVDSVRIYLDNRLVTTIPDTNFSSKGDLTAVDFLPKVADMVTLYFPHQQAGKLVAVQRAVSQSDYSHLRTRVDELIRGPLAGDEAALTNVFPVGITAKDLLSVQAQGDMAILRFSQSFVTNYPTDAAKERLMIYSIVNTLTSIDGIRRVQFLVQDSRVGALGTIDLTNPLIQNPGLNRK